MSQRRRAGTAVAVTLALASTGLTVAAAPAAAVPAPTSTVFINELHYDNDGGDVGEFVEVAGPVGTDLTDWSIVLYNGNGGAVYDTLALTGAIPASGFVVADGPANGIQNGAPDGVALASPEGLVQFLSYEGSFTAVGGPAAGMTSTDIGVAEAGTTPIGQSLQLTGTGSTYGDFTWQRPAVATPGAKNTGQTFGAPPADAPLTITNPSPVMATAGTASTFTVSATDPDEGLAAASFTGTPGTGVSVTGPTGLSSGTATFTVDVAITATPGTTELAFSFSTADETQTSPFTLTVVAPDAVTPIGTVQGAGATSPLVGMTATVEGVVVGDYQEAGQFGGFYVQSTTPDADPLTSEGIRVFNNTTPVAVGDLVRVRGTVSEFASTSNLYSGSETQFPAASTVTPLSTADVPAPTPITLPFAASTGGVDGQERFEGMLTTVVNDDLVATDLFTLGRFGEVSLTTGDLLYIPTTAGEDAANNADRVTLDDALSGQNLATLPYTIGGDGVTLPRAGDAPTDAVTGVFTFAFGEWRINPPAGTTIDFERLNPREPAPQDVGGNLQVASFNVLNYFTSFGGDNRGADNPAELQRQQDKLVAAITGLDADVVGLIEIANDDGNALATLVAALNDAQPDAADDYSAVIAPALTPANTLGGTYGTDAIRQAIIYRPSVVTPAGPPPSDPALLNPADPLFPAEPVFDRPPAVQDFTTVGGTREFTVVVNHFKSKGSNNAQCGTPDPFGGNCDDLRERQSAALINVVDQLGATDVALVGDFNAYERERPITILEQAGYVSAVADQAREDRSSYSFDGEFGSLDYVFLSRGLDLAKTGADIWQIDSPESVAYDYNSVNQAALYAPDAFASSDHDPLLVGFDLVPLEATGDFTLTLLHNNDGESSLLPAAPRGGIARFGTLVNELRTEAEAEGGVLLLSSGDNFLAGPQLQASLENAPDGPFYDAVALDYLDYDASAVGNHEFDFGPDTLAYFISQFKDSNIRFVSSNLDVSGSGALEQFASMSPGEAGALVEWTRTTVDGRSVAIVGATTPRLPSISSPGPDVQAREDVKGAVQDAITAATADGTEIVVLIAHLQNITEDQALVRELSGIDAVIAGGGDELLANEGQTVLLPGDAFVDDPATSPRNEDTVFGPYPLTATSLDGASVPIVTTQGSYGYLGRLVLDIDADGEVIAVDDKSGPVRNVFNATTPPADQKTPDAFLLENVERPVAAFTAALAQEVVAQSDVVLDARTAVNRREETNLGSLFADALRLTAERGATEFGATNPTVALQNSGGIRSDRTYGPGPISRLDSFQIAPFSNFVGYTIGLEPAKLKQLLERSVSAGTTTAADGTVTLQSEGRFGQISGIELVYDPARAAQTVVRNPDGSVTITAAGDRVRQVTLTNNTPDPADDIVVVRNGVVVAGAPAVDLAANSFTVGQNGDNYPFNLTEGQFINLPTTYQESLEARLRELAPLTAQNAPVGGFGRIVVGGDVVVEPEPEPEPAPGNSGTAPGKNKGPGDPSAPGNSGSAPGKNKGPAEPGSPGRSGSPPGKNRGLVP